MNVFWFFRVAGGGGGGGGVEGHNIVHVATMPKTRVFCLFVQFIRMFLEQDVLSQAFMPSANIDNGRCCLFDNM